MPACSRNWPARAWSSTSRTPRRSATSCARPASTPNGRANTATRPGRCWRSPSASCRNAQPMQGTDHGSRRSDAVRRPATAMSPRRRSLAATLEAWLGMLVEIPAALLVVAEIVILFAGVVARYVLHRPADLVGRTGLDPVPVARDAGRGGGVPPRRAHAHDGDRRQREARDAGLSRRRGDLRRAGLSAADRLAGLSNTPTRRASSPRRRCRSPTSGAPRRCRSASA